MPLLADIGANAAMNAADGAMSLITAGFDDRRQLRQNKKLLKQQSEADMAMAAYNQGLVLWLLKSI